MKIIAKFLLPLVIISIVRAMLFGWFMWVVFDGTPYAALLGRLTLAVLLGGLVLVGLLWRDWYIYQDQVASAAAEQAEAEDTAKREAEVIAFANAAEECSKAAIAAIRSGDLAAAQHALGEAFTLNEKACSQALYGSNPTPRSKDFALICCLSYFMAVGALRRATAAAAAE